MKIYIDPGHGGNDPGAIGPTGLKEKDVNLNIAVNVGKILSRHGINAILTRQGDNRVELVDRVKMANDNNADCFIIFISIVLLTPCYRYRNLRFPEFCFRYINCLGAVQKLL